VSRSGAIDADAVVQRAVAAATDRASLAVDTLRRDVRDAVARFDALSTRVRDVERAAADADSKARAAQQREEALLAESEVCCRCATCLVPLRVCTCRVSHEIASHVPAPQAIEARFRTLGSELRGKADAGVLEDLTAVVENLHNRVNEAEAYVEAHRVTASSTEERVLAKATSAEATCRYVYASRAL
jgi:hypothetical protein